MSEFAPAVAITLKAEGGFFWNHSTGEVVNHGITMKLLRDLSVLRTTGPATQADIDFVKSITTEEASDILFEVFWDKQHIGLINDQDVANKVFDLNVNTGHGILFLQKALGVTADGILGPKTASAANAIPAHELLLKIRIIGEDYYKELATESPDWAKDLSGWLSRLAA